MTVRKDPVSQLSQLRSPAAVQAAIDEFVQLGRTKFLGAPRLRQVPRLPVRDPKTGTDCDSKAIAGVAFGKQFPEQGPLTADSFSGGEATVVPALTRLGFRIIASAKTGPKKRSTPRSKTISTCCVPRRLGSRTTSPSTTGTAPTAERSQQVFSRAQAPEH